MSSEKQTISDEGTVIKCTDLGKCFNIYRNPRDRLKQFILPRMHAAIKKSPTSYYREFWALQNVSFKAQKGETIGIIGRNGSGKSTLLQMICGTLNPTSGALQTKGRISAILELGSGFNPEFTGRENVYLNGAVLGLSRKELEQRFDDIAAFADIGEFLEQPVKAYSSGMHVRLAFAIQAMVDPDIIVVDEALAVGDERFQRKCYSRLEELKSRGTSILFVSHSSASIVELCDYALLLEQGRQIMFAPASEAVRAYQRLLYCSEEARKGLVEDLLSQEQHSSERAPYPSSSLPYLDAPKQRVPSQPDKFAAENNMTDSFDPSLVPETTISYPIQGARIDCIMITNIYGKQVNVLESGRDYQFIITASILSPLPGFFVGIHIKSVSGVVITGQRYPEEGTYVKKMPIGQVFKCTFAFRMNLLPGVYFAGGGIWSCEEPSCAHRIIDALMFRVSTAKSVTSFGLVNLMSDQSQVTFE
jgi:lipopolysaccharide transport system ATP-binding protein